MAMLDGLDLGCFGIYTFDFEKQSATQIRDSVQQLEALGWPALWFPEVSGREALTHAAYLLSSTEHLRVVNGIAQIWARPAKSAYGAGVLLADAYPDRHVLGLGFGGGPRAGTTPLAAMSDYLDELDALRSADPQPQPPLRRLLAAYGPRMLELARDRTAGAHTYHVTVEHTAQARDVLGPGKFLAVEQAVLLEADPSAARAMAREHLQVYLSSPYNLAKFRRLGYTDDDFADGGSDRIVDALVFWGDLEGVVGKLQQHHDAGADHVCVQVIGEAPGRSSMPQWQALADALLA
jgi:probable F420-dependent oxidoreductase